MRKLLWTILLFCAYIWVITSGHDDFLFEKGKSLYKAITTWLDGAEIDYNFHHERASKKKARRWD